MNHPDSNFFTLAEGFRWFGPHDAVSLNYIRQTGATDIFTSLHEIPYGEIWPQEAIRQRRKIIETAGLCWTTVESLPVHEGIKTGRGDLKKFFRNYCDSMRHLAAEGITTVIYNFMPVLDWVRTEMRMRLPDGSECLQFNPAQFAAFELYALEREGAEADYTSDQLKHGAAWWKSLDSMARDKFIRNIIDVFPGVKLGLNLDVIRTMLGRYAGIDGHHLRENLARFLQEVVPVAEEIGVRLAIHPDDPPFSVLGLPRIVSKASDIEALFKMADSQANGICFCTGSFSARKDNDLPSMVRQFAPRIHAVHLRSTQRLPDGSFFEADHLAGSVDMPAVVRALLDEQDRRRRENRADERLTFRPDHGHTMLDDLGKRENITPGYSCIGRLRGLAELRGLMLGLRYAEAMGRS
ncbi:MAG: mannonate dehydratase [Chthoniobacteraceae bacterium]